MLELILDKHPDYRPNQTYGAVNPQRLPTFVLNTTILQRMQLLGMTLIRQCVCVTLDLLAKRGERFSDPECGYSLLHLAVSVGNIDVAKYLIEKYQNTDVNLTFKHRNTFWHPPLYHAVRNSHRQNFGFLLRNDADPFQRFQTD
jgi:Ankyrin repeats (3 copies)